jgi:epoxyqueuosine reductase
MIHDNPAERIAALFGEEGVPLFGYVPAAILEDEAPGHRPSDLLPGARSLVGFALPLPLGISAAPCYHTESVWRAQNLLYRRLDTIALRAAGLIEEAGFRALPNFGCCPVDMNGKGEVIGVINQLKIGVHAGLGVIGGNGLLVNSRYGSRMMLGSLVTTAGLDGYVPAEPLEAGCPDDCRRCVDACPVKAISMERKKVDIMKCLLYTAKIRSLPKLRFLLQWKTSPRRAARLLNQTGFDEHTMHVCSECVSVCPMGKGEKEPA